MINIAKPKNEFSHSRKGIWLGFINKQIIYPELRGKGIKVKRRFIDAGFSQFKNKLKNISNEVVIHCIKKILPITMKI